MRDSALEKSAEEQTRTLYSMRNSYAMIKLTENRSDLHTLSNQMGFSVAMIETHYSKLTAMMPANRLT